MHPTLQYNLGALMSSARAVLLEHPLEFSEIVLNLLHYHHLSLPSVGYSVPDQIHTCKLTWQMLAGAAIRPPRQTRFQSRRLNPGPMFRRSVSVADSKFLLDLCKQGHLFDKDLQPLSGSALQSDLLMVSRVYLSNRR